MLFGLVTQRFFGSSQLSLLLLTLGCHMLQASLKMALLLISLALHSLALDTGELGELLLKICHVFTFLGQQR